MNYNSIFSIFKWILVSYLLIVAMRWILFDIVDLAPTYFFIAWACFITGSLLRYSITYAFKK